MPHDHPLAQQPEVSMDDLDGQPIIMHAPPCDINDFLLTAFDRRDITLFARSQRVIDWFASL